MIHHFHEELARIDLIAGLNGSEVRAANDGLHDGDAVQRRFDLHAVDVGLDAPQFFAGLLELNLGRAQLGLLDLVDVARFGQDFFISGAGFLFGEFQGFGRNGGLHRNGLEIQPGPVEIRLHGPHGLQVGFPDHVQVSLQDAETRLGLGDRVAVVVQTREHILAIEGCHHVAFADVGARIGQFLERHHPV